MPRRTQLKRCAAAMSLALTMGTWSAMAAGPAIAPLAAKLSDADSFRVRVAAAVALGRSKDKSAAPALVRALSGDPHFAVRAASARALGGLADARTVEPLVDASRDADPLVASSALKALRAFNTPGSVEALAPLLEQGEPLTSLALDAFVAAQAQMPTAYPVLLARVGHADAAVAAKARGAIEALAEGPRTAALLGLLHTGSVEAQHEAARMLATHPAKAAAAPLLDYAAAPGLDHTLQDALMPAVQAHRAHVDVGALQAMAADAKAPLPVRTSSIAKLGLLPDAANTAILLTALTDRNARIRMAAARMLAALDDARVPAALRRAHKRERDPRAKAYLNRVLARRTR